MQKQSMFYDDRCHLTFDDVCLVDGLGTVGSRSDIDLSVGLPKGYSVELPVMTAAMDTITSPDMAESILDRGGVIFHHRNQSEKAREKVLRDYCHHDKVRSCNALNGVSVGLNVDPSQVETFITECGANLIGLEVAHAYMEKVADVVREIGPICDEYDVLLMVGNFSSAESAKWLHHETDDLVDLIKVSQGGGSACTTRLVTGIGKPTLQAVMDMVRTETPYKVVADGGIRTSGDLAKALGAGACAGMLGGMLSGTDETPGEVIVRDGQRYKRFRGMASAEAKEDAQEVFGHASTRNVEGVSTLVPYEGPVDNVFTQIRDGLQSSVASCGFESLEEFRREAKFIRVSTSSQHEAQPHAKNLK